MPHQKESKRPKENKRNVPDLTTFDTASGFSEKPVTGRMSVASDQPAVSLSDHEKKSHHKKKAMMTQEKSQPAVRLSLADTEKTHSVVRQTGPHQTEQSQTEPPQSEPPQPQQAKTDGQTLKKKAQKAKRAKAAKKSGTEPVMPPQSAQAVPGRQKTKQTSPAFSQSGNVKESRGMTETPDVREAVPVLTQATLSRTTVLTASPKTVSPKTPAAGRRDAGHKAANVEKTKVAQTKVTKSEIVPTRNVPTNISQGLARVSRTRTPDVSLNPVLPQNIQDIRNILNFTNDSCSDAIQAGMTLSKGLENVGMRLSDYIGRSAKSGLDFSRLLLHATSFKDAVSLHANFTGNMIEEFFEESRKITDIGFSASAQSLSPIHEKAAQICTTMSKATAYGKTDGS